MGKGFCTCFSWQSSLLAVCALQVALTLPVGTEWSTCPISVLTEQEQCSTGGLETRHVLLPPDDGEFAEILLDWFKSQVPTAQQPITSG